MEFKIVREGFAVAPQFAPEDMPALAEAGYVAVICNRPDGEEPGQPSIAAMRAAAESAGIAYHHIPVSGGEFPPAAIAAFGAVRRGTTGPVLAHCRTGTRSITLEALANPLGLSVDERLADATAAGYDLSALADRLD
jgi:sulfide:quinone oxidoreductase